MITDTHAHLYYPEIATNLDEILSRAADAGITKIIVPAVDIETSLSALKLSEKYEMIYCALGIHPGEVNKNELICIDEIEKLISHEKVVAIGEIGLDYYWDISNIEKQKDFFSVQTELAKSYELPVIIHTRKSVDDAIEIIDKKHETSLKGQFHCFSGNLEQLNKILKLEGFFVSFCGNITYKNFTESNVVLKCPIERLLSETDTPFLPPVPYRGKKNEPSYILKTLEKISEIKNTDLSTDLKNIYTNSEKLFFKN
ncbi:MAG TPA: TatD family hydrolase [Ignavibacteria bacterium]|nr:TatD family hydrolase [Ignavibacteria bacterium]